MEGIIEKYNLCNSYTDEEWEKKCISINDCSKCNMAVHQFLLSRTKHTCLRGMAEKKFKVLLESDDIY